MAIRHYATNDSWKSYVEEQFTFQYTVAGNVTADLTTAPIFAPNFSGEIVNVVLAFGQNGADGTDPLNMSAILYKNGTAVCSTNPDIAKAAGTGVKSTAVSGTGLTQAVVKTDGTEDFVTGDYFSLTLDITRTTPETEIANVVVVVYYKKVAS